MLQPATLTFVAEWIPWQTLFVFNLNWILMIKIHSFSFVEDGMTGSKGFCGKAYPQTFVIRTIVLFI